MNGKKNESVSIQKGRKVFLNVGLILSLALTITAFEWSFKSENFIIKNPEEVEDFISFTPVTIIDIPEPPKPIEDKPIEKTNPSTEIEIVPDNTEEILNKETTQDISDSLENTYTSIESSEAIEETDDALDYVDYSANPVMGLNKFRKEIGKEVAQSLTARDKRILHGKQLLIIEFIVEKNGSVSNIKTKKGVIASANKAAKRKIKNSGKWTPAQHEGRIRRQKFYLPIKITISN